ncbi:MAG: hypothetical protein AB8B79_06585 [Granulosicoccus sp.]
MKQCDVTEFDTLIPLSEALTVCATIDESGREQIVTDFMMRRACEQMEGDQIWPFSGGSLCHGYTQRSTKGADIIPFN